MSRSMIAVLTLAAVAACGRGDTGETAAADSLSRDLQLAPVDTSAELGDRPTTAERTPARPSRPAAATPRTSAATPAPSAPAVSTGLPAGASLSAATTAEIRSHKNKVGDTVTATIARDVKDNAGRIVVPAGSTVTLQLTAIKESENKRDSTGTLTLKPTSVSINGRSYPISATIQHVDTRLEGRKTNVGDIAKPAGGAAVGAVVGRVLGGSSKGAIIGGVIGGAVGAQRAVETKDRDVVLPEGTTVNMVLDETFRPTT